MFEITNTFIGFSEGMAKYGFLALSSAIIRCAHCDSGHIYNIGLISELRDPVVNAMAAAKEFGARDIKEDKEDAEKNLRGPGENIVKKLKRFKERIHSHPFSPACFVVFDLNFTISCSYVFV